jgi:hypothetical protein
MTLFVKNVYQFYFDTSLVRHFYRRKIRRQGYIPIDYTYTEQFNPIKTLSKVFRVWTAMPLFVIGELSHLLKLSIYKVL